MELVTLPVRSNDGHAPTARLDQRKERRAVGCAEPEQRGSGAAQKRLDSVVRYIEWLDVEVEPARGGLDPAPNGLGGAARRIAGDGQERVGLPAKTTGLRQRLDRLAES